MDRKEGGRGGLEQLKEALERERRMGAVATTREEAARDRRLTRIRFVLGALVLASNGGGEEAVARLMRDPRWEAELDKFVTDQSDRILFGLPLRETG